MKNHARGLELIKTVAHPVRIQILWLLSEGEQHVCHLITALGRRQAYVSQQLANLRRMGLILPSREGQHISYRLRHKELGKLLQKLCPLISPDCYVCLAFPVPWWLCPCPKCRDIRVQAGLSIEPFGTRGTVGRVVMSDCVCCACIRACQVSMEDVAVSMSSNCSHVQQWAAELHMVHIPSHGHGTRIAFELHESASGYLCRASCLVPVLALQTASVAAHLLEPASSRIECVASAEQQALMPV